MQTIIPDHESKTNRNFSVSKTTPLTCIKGWFKICKKKNSTYQIFFSNEIYSRSKERSLKEVWIRNLFNDSLVNTIFTNKTWKKTKIIFRKMVFCFLSLYDYLIIIKQRLWPYECYRGQQLQLLLYNSISISVYLKKSVTETSWRN